MIKRMFVVAMAVAACGKSGDKSGDKKTGGDNAGGDELSSLFTGTTVTMPPELAAVKFGAKEADVKAALGATSGYVPSKAIKNLSYDLRFTSGVLTAIDLDTTKQKLEPLITKQWGAPIKIKDREYWFSPDGLRIEVSPPTIGSTDLVQLSSYEAPATLLGGKGFDLAFAKGKPLFGATLDQLTAAWGPLLCDATEKVPAIKAAFAANAKDSSAQVDASDRTLALCLPEPRTIAGSPGRDRIELDMLGKVRAVSMSFQVDGSPELTKLVVDALDAKLGTPRIHKTKEGPIEHWYVDPAAKLQAIVRIDANYVGLTVETYLPLTDLIGAPDKPGLGIAGPHMPGGTFAEIQKDDPDHFLQSGELAALYYPATDGLRHSVEVSLEYNAGDKHTYGYRVTIHHTGDEAGGDALLALLTAKYGAPKPDKELTKPDDLFYNFAKGGLKLQARRVDQQWQLAVTK